MLPYNSAAHSQTSTYNTVIKRYTNQKQGLLSEKFATHGREYYSTHISNIVKSTSWHSVSYEPGTAGCVFKVLKCWYFAIITIKTMVSLQQGNFKDLAPGCIAPQPLSGSCVLFKKEKNSKLLYKLIDMPCPNVF